MATTIRPRLLSETSTLRLWCVSSSARRFRRPVQVTLRHDWRKRGPVGETRGVGSRGPLACRKHAALRGTTRREAHEADVRWNVIENGLNAAPHEIGFVLEAGAAEIAEEGSSTTHDGALSETRSLMPRSPANTDECRHDLGQVLNPMIVNGQQHGGIARGIGQALYRACRLRPRDGAAFVTGSFMDYAMPHADLAT